MRTENWEEDFDVIFGDKYEHYVLKSTKDRIKAFIRNLLSPKQSECGCAHTKTSYKGDGGAYTCLQCDDCGEVIGDHQDECIHGKYHTETCMACPKEEKHEDRGEGWSQCNNCFDNEHCIKCKCCNKSKDKVKLPEDLVEERCKAFVDRWCKDMSDETKKWLAPAMRHLFMKSVEEFRSKE